MSVKRSTGPKSTLGKKTSSRNATKHGLTASHPLTQAEDNQLAYLMKELNKEYKPKTMTEKILVDRVANTQLKIERLRQLERATFEKARCDAINESLILEKLDYDKELKEAFVENRIIDDSDTEKKVPAPLWEMVHSRLMMNLWELGQGSEPWRKKSYTDLKGKCPELHKRICYYCARKKYGISDFFLQFEEDPMESIKELATLFTARMLDPDLEVPEPEGPSYYEVIIKEDLLEKLPRQLFNRLKRDFAGQLFSTLIEEHQEVDAHTAIPSDAQMNQSIRYSTTLNNQLSKAIGELRLVIKERKEEETIFRG